MTKKELDELYMKLSAKHNIGSPSYVLGSIIEDEPSYYDRKIRELEEYNRRASMTRYPVEYQLTLLNKQIEELKAENEYLKEIIEEERSTNGLA
jgi:hypothetical protein